MRIALAFLLVAAGMAGCLSGEPAPAAPLEPLLIVPEPEVDFTWAPETPQPGQAVVFEPSGSKPEGTTITDWRWDFGDGQTSDDPAPIHRYDWPGLYEVTVEMAISDGQQTRAAHVVPVLGDQPSDTSPVTGTQGSAPPSATLPDGPPTVFMETLPLGISFWFEWEAVPDDVAWDFGDGTTSKLGSPKHAYTAPGTYNVTLSVTLSGKLYQTFTWAEATDVAPAFRLSDVGAPGPEPSVGVTSNGCIFFIARASVMRSCDAGVGWTDVSGLLAPVIDSDPYLWVDKDTDRVFRVNMLDLVCTQIGFTDDGGSTWVQNSLDCGTVPINDHIKLGTGPWTGSGYGLIGSQIGAITYPNAVYFCYNKLVAIHCYTSFDGGLTFPVGGLVAGPADIGSGLHGAIETAPDGTVYVPARTSPPRILRSTDNGMNWVASVVGSDVGTADPMNNAEVAVDTANNVYVDWQGADNGLYLAHSTNGGQAWSKSFRITPPEIGSTAFPTLAAGSPGRIAAAYLGSSTTTHGDLAEDDARWDLYVSFSLDALSADPTFITVRVTDDPVQVGSIHFGGGSDPDRNLLDFIDLSLDKDGRAYVAYADGCTGACSTKVDPAPDDSRDDRGMVAILETGPSLYKDKGWLSPLN